LEAKFEGPNYPKCQAAEFKDITWSKDQDDLAQRLVRIKALQLKPPKKSTYRPTAFIQRLKREPQSRGELTPTTSNEKKQLVLAYVLKATSSLLIRRQLILRPQSQSIYDQVQQRFLE